MNCLYKVAGPPAPPTSCEGVPDADVTPGLARWVVCGTMLIFAGQPCLCLAAHRPGNWQT